MGIRLGIEIEFTGVIREEIAAAPLIQYNT